MLAFISFVLQSAGLAVAIYLRGVSERGFSSGKTLEVDKSASAILNIWKMK